MMDEQEWPAYRRDMKAMSVFERMGSHAVQVAYLGCGLAGEAAEACDAELRGADEHGLEEMADAAWYLGMLEETTGLRVTWPARAPWWALAPWPLARLWRALASVRLVLAAARAAEALKRPLQGRDIPPERLLPHLNACALQLHALAERHGGMPAVMAASRQKIMSRFGGQKWTPDALRARDAAEASR